MGLLNRRLMTAICFRDSPHESRAVRGMGTISLEEGLLQQMMEMREVVLYKILLDLQTSHNALVRDRCMDVLEGYYMVPQEILIIQTYWIRLTMVVKAGE